jgi:hypothetical protein
MNKTPFGLIASGDLYMDFYDDSGNHTGFQLVGNCKKFAPKVETETKENKSNGRDTFGQTTESFARITSSTISLVFNRYDPTILAAAFMGTAIDQVSAAGSYTATITGIKDRWVEIGETGLETVEVKDETDTTTYVAGTDYEVNKRIGMVKVLTATLEGQVLHVTGNRLAKTGYKVTGATRPVVNVALRLDGKNLATGADILATVFQAQLRSDTEFDFMGEDFPELSFSGTMITPTGKSWPFEVV